MTSSVLGFDTKTDERVEIPKTSRLQGLYIIGIQGTGKSGLIENLILQDIKQDIGVCLLDPHGDLTHAVLSRLPDRRVHDVIYLDIADYHSPFGVNLFSCSDLTNPVEVQKTVDQVMHIFEKLFDVARTTPLIIQYLRNCTQTLIANPGYTMADIPLLLRNRDCRQKLVANVRDRNIVGFWQEYEDMKPSEQREEREPILRRLEELLQPLTFNIVGQSTTTIDIRQVMDEGKILLVKLSAQLPYVTSLIGSVFIAFFLNAAYSRSALDIKKRKQFNLYADEFQRFATEDFATLLEEARKFGIGITIAHQNRGQLEPSLRDRTRSAANLVVFKVNSKDAADLAGEFTLTPQPADTRPEEIRMPVSDVIGHLLKQGGHRNPLVNEFVRRYHLTSFKQDSTPLRALNRLLSRANSGISPQEVIHADQNAYFDLVCSDLVWVGYQTLGGFLPEKTHYINRRRLLTDVEKAGLIDLFCNPMQPDSAYDRATRARLTEHATKEELWKFCQGIREEVNAFLEGKGLTGEPLQHAVKAVLAEIEQRPQYQGALRLDFATLVWLKFTLALVVYDEAELDREYNQNYLYYTVHKPSLFLRRSSLQTGQQRYDWILKGVKEVIQPLFKEKQAPVYRDYNGTPYQEAAYEYQLQGFSPDWITPEKQVELLTPFIEQPIATQKPILVQFLRDLHEMLALLATDPILQGSGQYEEKPVALRTYADMQNEIAANLVNLPAFTTRVRIAREERMSEHTLRTLDPKQQPDRPLFGQALQARLDSMKKQNIQDGYVRPRQVVEEEIRTRQEQCSQPLTDEPPISRRPPR